MGAELRVESLSAPTGGLAEAFYFGSAKARLFGWLHTPRLEPMASIGLVLCNPFGHEAICSHRAVRALAEKASALGVPALRFDYLGTGDSAEIDPQADQIDVWSGDVLTAVAELQRRTGVERVYLLGFRLGGLLAALAARRCKAVDGLILIAPIVSGRRYVRELRTTRLASLLGSDRGDSASTGPAAHTNVAAPGSLEVSGFSLAAATLATLATIDLASLDAPEVTEMLVVDGSGVPAAHAWSEALSKLGRGPRYLTLPGLAEMIVSAPQYAISPRPIVAALDEWLRQCLSKLPRSDEHGPRAIDPHALASTGTLTLPGSSQSAPLIERPVFFGSETLLFGIVTEPSQSETRRRAVVLLNAGADHHVGPSRKSVSLARRWARRGYFVLRMDIGGLGDSSTRRGRPDDEVFPPAALDDIRAGVEFLKTRYRVSDITLTGLCSGAYHALRAAVAAVPVNRILMVNPLNFFWKEGMMLDDLQVAEVVQNSVLYGQRVLSGAAWKRLLSGQVNVWRIVQTYIQRALLPLESMLRDWARRLRIHLPNDLGRELEEIAARGVQIAFVFAHGEPAIDLLKIEGGSSVKRIGSKCRVHIIESADHVFSHSATREALENTLSEELFARIDLGPLQNRIAIDEECGGSTGEQADCKSNTVAATPPAI